MSRPKASGGAQRRIGASWLAPVQTSAPPATSGEHSDPADLQRFVEIIADTAPPWPPEVVAWLRDSFTEFRASDWKKPIHGCLGFIGNRGHRKYQTRARYAERDRWLLAAWDELAPAESDWALAHELLKEIDNFEELYWPALRNESCPEKGATRLRVALFNAFRAMDGEMPRHWRQLKTLVQRRRASCGTTG